MSGTQVATPTSGNVREREPIERPEAPSAPEVAAPPCSVEPLHGTDRYALARPAFRPEEID